MPPPAFVIRMSAVNRRQFFVGVGISISTFLVGCLDESLVSDGDDDVAMQFTLRNRTNDPQTVFVTVQSADELLLDQTYTVDVNGETSDEVLLRGADPYIIEIEHESGEIASRAINVGDESVGVGVTIDESDLGLFQDVDDRFQI